MLKNLLRLIKGGKKEKPVIDYERIYLEGMIRTMEAKKLDFDNKELAQRLFFYIVKYFEVVEMENKSLENHESMIVFNHVLMDTMKGLTPEDMMTIFPPAKTYDGEKWGIKDYFTTMAALNEHGIDKQIGTEEAALNLLWDFMNPSVMKYRVKIMSVMSNLNRLETGQGLMERFIEDQELNLPVYRAYTDNKGKSFLLDENGKSIPVIKRLPRYLKLAK
ncbi:hypothetical protein AKG39_11820 [Acetobacterium bakii]|uniref:Uncharacterized protein n=1 Tax=Acetobacterium bakii TaxID=52689 RepID=A0A0L6U0X4_9FIRM|nr:hypothetical protein [Acetobacterium bakii]KNZ41450.1 hypothetical protein AKG39_11820 [Acetobacterium bakii]